MGPFQWKCRARDDYMNPSRSPGALAAFTILILGAAMNLPLPHARADFEIVTVVAYTDNIVAVNLDIDGNDVNVSVTRQFTIHELDGIDEMVDNGVKGPGAWRSEAFVETPESACCNRSADRINITFNTTFPDSNNISVKYHYSLGFRNVGALNFSRILRCASDVHGMFEHYTMTMSDLTFMVHSNIAVSVDDGSGERSGTDLKLNYTVAWNPVYPRSLDVSHLVRWNCSASPARVDEAINTHITATHRTLIDNFIKSESVNITIMPGPKGLSYSLHGDFYLNFSTVKYPQSVWLWFPNNISSAQAWMPNDPCKVQESVIDGQKGFYLLLERAYNYPYHLVVNITGNMTDNWCDFFIVTVPVENSSVRYILPNGTKITAGLSTFEMADYGNSSDKCILEFHGRCTCRGPVHVEWDPNTLIPCNLSASLSNITCDGADLSWTTTANPDFVRYEILKSNISGEPGSVVANITNQSCCRYNVGLGPNTTSYLTVRKVMSSWGNVDSVQLVARTPPDPPGPSKVLVSRLARNESIAAITWSPSKSRDFKCYQVFQSTVKGELGTKVACMHEAPATGCNLTGLDRDRPYYITVVTVTHNSGQAQSVQARLAPAAGQGPVEPGPHSPLVGVVILALLVLFVLIFLAAKRAR